MDDHPSSVDTEKQVVLIGTPSDDGVNAKINSLGYRYTRRLLTAGPRNWFSIAAQLRELADRGFLAGCIILLSDVNIDRCIMPEHEAAWQEILTGLETAKSIAFVYEETFEHIHTLSPCLTPEPYPFRLLGNSLVRADFLGGHFIKSSLDPELVNPRKPIGASENYVSYDFSSYGSSGSSFTASEDRFLEEKKRIEKLLAERNELARQLFERMEEHGIEIVPCRTRLERLIRTERFLEATVRGEFLRLYVPHGRYQAEQLRSFLRLFENYLRRIEGRAFGIDIEQTEHGSVYIFRSTDGSGALGDFDDAVERFESLLQMYEFNPEEAETLLSSMGMDASEARQLLSKYARDFKRLMMDIKHEYESKVLLLRQELETRVLELSESRERSITPVDAVGTPDLSPALLLNPLPVVAVDLSLGSSDLMRSMLGDVSYTLLDRELIDLFDKFGKGTAGVQLKSNLDQLKDKSAPREARVESRQRIAGFLFRMMPVLGRSVVSEYVRYLNSRLEEQHTLPSASDS